MEESRGALLFQKVCHILNIILKVAVMVIIAFPFYWMNGIEKDTCVKDRD